MGPVPSAPGKTLTFRGIKNFDATMDWAFAHGMTEATEFVLTGGSAGGLSTFLHADRIAARLAIGRAGPRDLVALGRSAGCVETLTQLLDARPVFAEAQATLSRSESSFVLMIRAVWFLWEMTFGICAATRLEKMMGLCTAQAGAAGASAGGSSPVPNSTSTCGRSSASWSAHSSDYS